MSEAQKRNFVRWRVLGRSHIANRDPGSTTYQGEVDTLKTWLRARLQWMDKHIELLPQKVQYYPQKRRSYQRK
ncbi:hypothetical protein F4212_14995 [Candidatus Poribacteria bacterium]|nr:hypothetical protein [Candidatus Poribacteria bacterium]